MWLNAYKKEPYGSPYGSVAKFLYNYYETLWVQNIL